MTQLSAQRSGRRRSGQHYGRPNPRDAVSLTHTEHVGRIGSLAIALGVGAALMAGTGSGVAHADTGAEHADGEETFAGFVGQNRRRRATKTPDETRPASRRMTVVTLRRLILLTVLMIHRPMLPTKQTAPRPPKPQTMSRQLLRNRRMKTEKQTGLAATLTSSSPEPAAPGDAPFLLALLSWARREFEKSAGIRSPARPNEDWTVTAPVEHSRALSVAAAPSSPSGHRVLPPHHAQPPPWSQA